MVARVGQSRLCEEEQKNDEIDSVCREAEDTLDPHDKQQRVG